MVRLFKSFLALSCVLLVFSEAALAGFVPIIQLPPQKPDKEEKKKKKRDKKASKEDKETSPIPANGAASGESIVNVVADTQSKLGDLFMYEGYVNATLGEYRLQADRVTLNNASGDMVAEGNVIFDQGADQRVTARRAEINWISKRGVFWNTTGFTNRTQTGEYIFFTADRVEKTGDDTYELFDASITACEDVVPKWSFSAARAEIKMDDRVVLRKPIFRIKGLPAFALPYAWIPATESERKSGFLLPTTGSSNQKGRTLKSAYYQTLGQSADITFRNDLYTARGLGFGAEFRAQTSEKSFMRLGVFTVKDRLFGEPGENQGGTAFVGEGVQYLPRGWLLVGNASLVTSLRFRQAFSDDISQVIDPRRESTFYANNNAGGAFSFNFLAANESTRLFRPDNAGVREDDGPVAGSNVDVDVRQAPQIDLTVYPRRIFSNLPIYFSFDTSVGALRREESFDDEITLVTPSAVQRLDFQSKFTAPLATFAGIAVTPNLSLRQTFYSSSLDPLVPLFDPAQFTFKPDDPRLDPARSEFDPDIRLFDRAAFDPIIPDNLSRRYAELTVDVRPPALEKYFLREDGSRRFKHLIEPYITYRLIRGIGDEFDNIVRFDERDAVANTNEFEYAIVNRFYTTRRTNELRRRSRRQRRDDQQPSEMEPLQPGKEDKKRRKKSEQSEISDPKSEIQEKDQGKEKKPKLQTGEQAELGQPRQQRRRTDDRDGDDDDQTASNRDEPTQAHEILSVKVAQKYFFDRDFGGALIPGRRNQFYPINTLSGFTFGGVERSFSPVNVAVRYTPLAAMFADVRMDIGSVDGGVRDVMVSGGMSAGRVSASTSWNLSRRIDVDANRFEAGTFPGNQIVTTLRYGDQSRGFYAGTRIGYDFTNRFDTAAGISNGRLRNSRTYMGHAWDCCGVQFNYNTFKAGLRNESAFSFTFTLAGLGSFGTDQFAQLGGGQGGRRRGRRARRDRYDYEDF